MAIHTMDKFRQIDTKGGFFSKTLLLLGALASILWSVYFAAVTISIPYPIEFREGAAQVMTQFLLNRSNPFRLESQPLAMNNYGLGYNMVVAPFAALFGNTLSIHRSVTFAFILLSALVGFITIRKLKDDIVPALACGAFIMVGLIARGGIGAFPAAMGTFLFMLAIVFPYLRGFSRLSLVVSILCSVVAFYTKAYFVLGFGIVGSYLFLFVSKKTALIYGVTFLVLFVSSLLVVRLAFPLYFVNTIIGNISNTERSSAHLLSQLSQLLSYFFPVVVCSVFLLVLEKDSFSRRTGLGLNTRGWKQPLIPGSPDYFFYSFVCALLAFVLFLGSHIGSYLSYAYQLVVPLFFCWFFLKLNLQKKIVLLMVLPILVNLVLWEKSLLAPQLLEQKDSKAWASLYSHVKSSSNILNSPVVTSMVLEQGLNPLDSGQTSYYYAIKPYPNIPILGPAYEVVEINGFRYVKFIDNSIKQQKFDLVITTREKSTFYHAKLLEDFYAPVGEIKVDMPQTGQQWTLLLWRPQAK